mmetsp:Transcript_88823/g.251819  ORF Transcript_88823/g.251819 Transcript_88823/m.251819 type:complete len:265 (-) Transcript_88823:2390-3184(-)
MIQSLRAHRYSLLGLLLAKAADDLHQVLAERLRVHVFLEALHDVAVDLRHLVGVEGRPAAHHDEEHHAEGPPIHGPGVAHALHHLGGEEARGAAHREGGADHKLREAHVGDLQPAPRVQEQVLGLHVPVDHEALVHVLERADHAATVVPGMGLFPKELVFPVNRVQVAAHTGLQEEVEFGVGPKRLDDGYDEVGAHHFKDVLLIENLVLHVLLHDAGFLHTFQGVDILGVLVLAEVDGSEGTFSDWRDQLEVLHLDRQWTRSQK